MRTDENREHLMRFVQESEDVQELAVHEIITMIQNRAERNRLKREQNRPPKPGKIDILDIAHAFGDSRCIGVIQNLASVRKSRTLTQRLDSCLEQAERIGNTAVIDHLRDSVRHLDSVALAHEHAFMEMICEQAQNYRNTNRAQFMTVELISLCHHDICAEDVISPTTGDTIMKAGEACCASKIEELRAAGIVEILVKA